MFGDDIRSGGFTVQHALAEAARIEMLRHPPAAREPVASRPTAAPRAPRAARVRRRRYLSPEDRLPKAAPGNAILYVIESLHLSKIGKATNFYGRESNIRVDNPHGVTVRFMREMPADLVKTAESMFKRLHKPRQIQGDWYAIPIAEAVAEAERIANLVLAMPR